jgi:hypothetical protein
LIAHPTWPCALSPVSSILISAANTYSVLGSRSTLQIDRNDTHEETVL